jgi:hypothetical protein
VGDAEKKDLQRREGLSNPSMSNTSIVIFKARREDSDISADSYAEFNITESSRSPQRASLNRKLSKKDSVLSSKEEPSTHLMGRISSRSLAFHLFTEIDDFNILIQTTTPSLIIIEHEGTYFRMLFFAFRFSTILQVAMTKNVV